MYNSWTSSLTLIQGSDCLHPSVFVTHLPSVCDPTVLRDAQLCVYEDGWVNYHCLLGLVLSYILFVLGFFSLSYAFGE